MGLTIRYLCAGLSATAIALASPLAAGAHEVGIQADVEVRSASGGLTTYSPESIPSSAQITAVTVTVIYSTQEPMANGRIQIYAPGNSSTPWRTGRLDEDGRYRFSPDVSKRGRWTIRVQSEGHSNFMNLVILDLPS